MTRPLSEPNVHKDIGRGHWRTSQLERRPTTPVNGQAIYCIEVFEPENLVIVADERFEFEIPEDLDGATLVKVDAYLTEPSTSGTVQVQLAHLPDGFTAGETDILSTKINIEVGEVNMKESATQPVIDDITFEYAWGDHVRVDIDNAGSGAYGLGLILYFFPATTTNVAIQGAKGDPGGVTSWEGGWEPGPTTYLEGQVVSNNGTSYVAIQDVPVDIEPGVTPGWETYWMVLAEAEKTSSVDLIIDGNGYVIDIGPKASLRVPYDCTLVECQMLADQTGSIVIDIWKDTYANYPPTNADSITSSSPPTISAQDQSIDTILSGWTTALSEDDILMFNVDSCSTIQRVTISLKFDKT